MWTFITIFHIYTLFITIHNLWSISCGPCWTYWEEINPEKSKIWNNLILCSLWSDVLSFELLVLGFGAYLVVLAISVRGLLASAGAEVIFGGGSDPKEEETKFSMHRNKVELELIFKLQMIWNDNLEEKQTNILQIVSINDDNQ